MRTLLNVKEEIKPKGTVPMEKNKTQPPLSESTPAGLTARQEKLLSILAVNPNIQAAAQAAGIGRTTAHRWLNEPCFREELTRRRHAAMNESMSAVQTQSTRAIDELIKLLDTPNEWLRRQICMDLLNGALRIRETEEIEQRLSAIEKALALNTNNRSAT
jgi:hypothetical protein